MEGAALALRHNLEGGRAAGAQPASLVVLAAGPRVLFGVKSKLMLQVYRWGSTCRMEPYLAAFLAGIGVGAFDDTKLH